MVEEALRQQQGQIANLTNLVQNLVRDNQQRSQENINLQEKLNTQSAEVQKLHFSQIAGSASNDTLQQELHAAREQAENYRLLEQSAHEGISSIKLAEIRP